MIYVPDFMCFGNSIAYLTASYIYFPVRKLGMVLGALSLDPTSVLSGTWWGGNVA